ncbi:LPXTG cell wall anchor domain-containing protein [Kitasatospora sp. NPDC101155]|uniref:LPXTG cell wall anchor domain-containing protein n=1 Tax=Kitasatospora sp. NPDC101155 TaxID=3364097 RepID=UPI0037F7EF9E
MRTSVITRFAKNDRSFSGRRRIAVLAATTVLAGGVQVLAMSDTAWACGNEAGDTTAVTSPAAAPAQHDGNYSAGFHMTPDGQTITAGGAKVEIGVGVTNFTGAPYQNVSAMLALFSPKSGDLRTEDLTVEVATAGGWKPVALRHGCDPTIFTVDSPATTTARLENGRAANFMFRVGLSAKAPKDLTEIQIGTGAEAPGFPTEPGEAHTFHVARTATPAQPTAPAKPKPTKPAAPAKPAKPAPAEPAADKTPAKAAESTKAPAADPAAPTATPSAAPATTAPAGTPELAHTGASETNTFLAVSAAALLALGAGVLIAVRRLRSQR